MRKRPKAEGKMSPKVLLEKNKERKHRKKRGEEKRTMAALLVFLLTSLEFLKEKNCLRGEFCFGCNVIQKSSSDIYFSYPRG